mmetsp:Transcript_18021/g.49057  ORF Transcript_18021/g.49057 Transcript_18021/m.49057 type:complete len:301 (+) Transcript_18021:118-1020(+)
MFGRRPTLSLLDIAKRFGPSVPNGVLKIDKIILGQFRHFQRQTPIVIPFHLRRRSPVMGGFQHTAGPRFPSDRRTQMLTHRVAVVDLGRKQPTAPGRVVGVRSGQSMVFQKGIEPERLLFHSQYRVAKNGILSSSHDKTTIPRDGPNVIHRTAFPINLVGFVQLDKLGKTGVVALGSILPIFPTRHKSHVRIAGNHKMGGISKELQDLFSGGGCCCGSGGTIVVILCRLRRPVEQIRHAPRGCLVRIRGMNQRGVLFGELGRDGNAIVHVQQEKEPGGAARFGCQAHPGRGRSLEQFPDP